jgi:hypothetical protein
MLFLKSSDLYHLILKRMTIQSKFLKYTLR